MTKPTTRYLFATDATFTADSDSWGGEANKVDPGATRFAEGYEPDLLPAEWINYHLNSLGGHIDYIHDVLEDNDWPVADAATKRFPPVPLIIPGSTWTQQAQLYIDTTNNSTTCYIDVTLAVHAFSNISAFSVRIGQANTASTTGVGWQLHTVSADTTTTLICSGNHALANGYATVADGDNGGTALSSAHVVDKSLRYRLGVTSSDNAAGGGAGDEVFYCIIDGDPALWHANVSY